MRVVVLVLALGLGVAGAGCFDPDQARVRDLRKATAWEPGDMELHGTVERVTLRQMASGPVQVVRLEGEAYDACSSLLLPATPVLRPGDRIEATLHWRERDFNGVPAVWSAQMPCPGPAYLETIADVLDSVAYVGGGAFLPSEAVPGGVAYEYVSDRAPIALDGLRLRLAAWSPGDLPTRPVHGTGLVWQSGDDPLPPIERLDGPRQWQEASARLFATLSAATVAPEAIQGNRSVPGGFRALEEITLGEGTGDHLRFTDAGLPGFLDAGDRLQVVNLPDGFYALQLTDCGQPCGVIVQAILEADGRDLTRTPLP